MNIALIGYRGTGKTSVGRLLAEQCQLTFRDADTELTQLAGRNISDIFAQEGETHFRDLESQVLERLLQGNQQVLSLGGGVVLREENRQRLTRPSLQVVWLTANPETILRRLQADPVSGAQRPALTTATPQEEIVQVLTLRTPLYRECADFTVSTEGKTLGQIVAEVVSLVNSAQ